ncbi:unnamed protein product [Phytomonas sp. Hart1]|nr:unnamed protein product [Phytomonas sp. Hart1]|eukprot:CCW69057.1 unnamed protein product [Phytomonas sp. isolate Hart1]
MPTRFTRSIVTMYLESNTISAVGPARVKKAFGVHLRKLMDEPKGARQTRLDVLTMLLANTSAVSLSENGPRMASKSGCCCSFVSIASGKLESSALVILINSIFRLLAPSKLMLWRAAFTPDHTASARIW